MSSSYQPGDKINTVLNTVGSLTDSVVNGAQINRQLRVSAGLKRLNGSRVVHPIRALLLLMEKNFQDVMKQSVSFNNLPLANCWPYSKT